MKKTRWIYNNVVVEPFEPVIKSVSKDTRNETKRIEKTTCLFKQLPIVYSKLRCRGKRVKKGKRNASCELDAKTIRALETSVEWIRR